MYPCSVAPQALALPGFITLGARTPPWPRRRSHFGLGVPQARARDAPTLCPALELLPALLREPRSYCTTRARVQYLRGSSPQGHMDFPAWGKGSRHGGAQGREGLIPRAQGQHLAADLRRVCLIPDKEATPGTWLANGCSLGNNSEGSADPSPHQHLCQDRLFSPGCTELALAGYMSPSGHPHFGGTAWHGMAWHMARGQRSSWHTAQPGQMGMECRKKQGAPSSANQTRFTPGPATSRPILPQGLQGHGANEGAYGQGQFLASWSCYTAGAQEVRDCASLCCHPDPVASVGHL